MTKTPIEEAQDVGRDAQALFERIAKLHLAEPMLGIRAIKLLEDLVALLRSTADGGD
jgi:hypothetical protein